MLHETSVSVCLFLMENWLKWALDLHYNQKQDLWKYSYLKTLTQVTQKQNYQQNSMLKCNTRMWTGHKRQISITLLAY